MLDKHSHIYLAGHSGLVGAALKRLLQGEGFASIVTRSHAELDLIDQKAVQAFLGAEKLDFVIVAAAKVGGIHANNAYPAEFIYENLMIQANVIHEAWRAGVEELLFLGSSCIYPRKCPQPMKEEYLLTGLLEATNEPYAVAKIAGIKLCEAYNRQHGTCYRSVMPTNLYGPYDNFDLESSHVLPALIRKFHLAKAAAEGDWDMIAQDEERYGFISADVLGNLAAVSRSRRHGVPEKYQERLMQDTSSAYTGDAVVLWGTGTPRREFLHVDDMASACLFVMRNMREIPDSFVNIGAGEDLTIRELAAMVREIVDYQGAIQYDTTKPDGTPQKLLDVSRLTHLGWRPRIGLREGIEQTYQWYKECES